MLLGMAAFATLISLTPAQFQEILRLAPQPFYYSLFLFALGLSTGITLLDITFEFSRRMIEIAKNKIQNRMGIVDVLINLKGNSHE